MSMEEVHKIKGYTVILIPSKSKNTFIQSYIQTGNIDENKKNAGISHLMEHIFADSWKTCRGPCSEYWKEIGTISNAYTSNSFVGYWIMGLKEQAERMTKYVIAQSTCTYIKFDIMKKERRAVREEYLKE